METLEAAIAVYIVRFGLVVAALAVGIANWVRMSRVQRLRLTLPDDLKANVSRLTHEVDSVNESLRAHVAKEDMRINRAEKKAAEAALAQGAAAGVEMPSVPPPAPTLSPRQLKLALNRAASMENDKRRGRRGA